MYDAFPDLPAIYDSVPLYVNRRDAQFYLDEASSARGTVLEVGCGTGRILLPSRGRRPSLSSARSESQRPRHDVVVAYLFPEIEGRGSDDPERMSWTVGLGKKPGAQGRQNWRIIGVAASNERVNVGDLSCQGRFTQDWIIDRLAMRGSFIVS